MKTTTFLMTGIMACTLLSCTASSDKTENLTTVKGQQEITTITGVARIEPEKGLLSIYAGSNGIINRIAVSENEQVTEGSPLLYLQNSAEKALLEVEESKLTSQYAAIEAAVRNAQSVKSELDKAKSDLQLNEQLFEAKGITRQALNDSRANVEKLSSDYAKAVADRNQQSAVLTEIQANINYRRALLDEKALAAPFTGNVLQWEVHQGDYVTTGQKLGQFAPEGPLVAVTEIDELFQERVKEGMKADIYSQLNGERIATGTVVYVAGFLKKKSLFSDENTVEDRRVKEVKVRLDASSKAVINSKVDCTIYLK